MCGHTCVLASPRGNRVPGGQRAGRNTIAWIQALLPALHALSRQISCGAPCSLVQHTADEYGEEVGADGRHRGGPFTLRVSPKMRVEDLRRVIRVSAVQRRLRGYVRTEMRTCNLGRNVAPGGGDGRRA